MKVFKRILTLLLTGIILLSLASCGGDNYLIEEGRTTITVAASPTPHAQILEVCKPLMEEKGYILKIREFDDYVLPNKATESGDVDANYFQHTPYLEEFNAQHKTHLVSVCGVHYEPFGIYSGKKTSLDQKTGLTIAVPNDGTNEARALLLLEQEGFITLKKNVGLSATIRDIEDTKGNEIVELEAALVATSRSSCDLVVLNGNYAINAGLKVTDMLAVEDQNGEAANTYVNILVVREGNENHPIVKALAECLLSEKVKNYINTNFAGSVVPKF